MTINGNFKFFETSKALFINGDTATVSSGDSSKNNAIDFDKTTRWESVSSTDAITETYLVTFAASVELSRLLLLNHNFEDYTITPVTSGTIDDSGNSPINDSVGGDLEDEGGSSIPFINVISLISGTETTGISETGYSLSNSYYEFTKVDCLGLLITITKAQALNDEPNQEKFLYRLIPTIEVDENQGTFEGFPVLQRPRDFFGKTSRGINGRYNINKLQTIFTAGIGFSNGNKQSDINLVEHLRYRNGKFLIWPNGGNLSSDDTDDFFYRFNFTPYKLDDIYKVQVDDSFLPSLTNNIFLAPFNTTFGIREVD